MQYTQDPTPRSRTPRKGGKGVGGGPPVEKSNEGYEYAAEQPVRDMTHPGTLSQSEHENAHAMSNVLSEIPAYEDARAMSDTRVMLPYETSLENKNETTSTCTRATMPKLPQMGHPEIYTRTVSVGARYLVSYCSRAGWGHSGLRWR